MSQGRSGAAEAGAGSIPAARRFPSIEAEEQAMTWETPTVEDIACGMEVTSYAPASGIVAEHPEPEQTADRSPG
jgi:coenzyme PQQ precursor peptide PqqA